MKEFNFVKALISGDTENALKELKEIYDVNQPYSFKQPIPIPPRRTTYLMIACQKSTPEVIEALLKRGAQLTDVDEEGRNLLHIAQSGGKLDNVKMLLKYDPSLRIKGDSNGNTPLHEAAGDRAKKKFFLSYFDSDLPFCEVDVRNKEGNTPLHLVAQRGALRECEILLDHGADPEAKNKNEETPFAFITEEVCPEVKELFQVEINKRKNPPTLFQFCASKAQMSGLISELTIPQNDIRQKAIISAKYMLNTAQNLQAEDHLSQKIESLKI